MTALTVLAVSAVVAVSVVAATPLKTQPPFLPHPDNDIFLAANTSEKSFSPRACKGRNI